MINSTRERERETERKRAYGDSEKTACNKRAREKNFQTNIVVKF